MRFLFHPAGSRPHSARTLRCTRAARAARLLGGLGLVLAATALPAQQAQYHEENGYLVREISGSLAGAAPAGAFTVSVVAMLVGTAIAVVLRISGRSVITILA